MRTGNMGKSVLDAVATTLVVLWLIGLGAAYTLGGLVQLFPIAAIVVILIRWKAGPRFTK